MGQSQPAQWRPSRRQNDATARPFEGPGVTRRIAPFVIAGVLAYTAAPFVREGGSPWDLVAAGILIVSVIAAIYLLPWERLPAWMQVLPPAAVFVIVALIRNDTGGEQSEFTGLLALPLIWFCLYGSRAQLLGAVAGVAATIALPAILIGGADYPSNEIVRAVVTALIAGTLGISVQRLVDAVRGAEDETGAILRTAREAFISVDEEGTICEWNHQAERDFGWTREEALGRKAAETVIPERFRERLQTGMLRFLETGEGRLLGQRVEGVARRRDGTEFPVEMSISATRTRNGIRFTAFLLDITERRRRQHDLQQAEERFRRAFDDAGIGMALTGPDGRFLRVNGALAEMTGYPVEHLTGLSFRRITDPEDVGRDGDAFEAILAGRRDRYRTETRYRHAEGRAVWIDLNVTPVRAHDGRLEYLIVQMQDISERKGAEERLAFQASHDPLTGLPNRVLLADRMEVALARLRRSDLPLAVLFCDLDRFKLVNDSFGHDAGDRLLLEASQRLRGVVRPSDTVARLGGDEFAILCEAVTPDSAATMATRVGEVLAVPFRVEGREVVITSSIGIAINRDPDVAPGTLLANADAAMYEAKMRGRSRYAFFATEMRTRSTNRLELEADLRAAVGAGHLQVHYQPQVELESGRIIAVEAFARWDHPERGLLDASEFIPMAEESDLVVAVGAFVMEQAAIQTLRWRNEINPELGVTVNVSARELGGPELAGTVAETLVRTGLPGRALCIEMTESAVTEDVESAYEAIRDLKDLGVKISVDEFGIGTSTIGLLRRVPDLDSLKIDPLFVAGLGSPGGRADLVGVIVGMAGTMGMSAIAEGVESEAQLEALRELRCDAGQGHYLGGPAAPEVVEELLRDPASRP